MRQAIVQRRMRWLFCLEVSDFYFNVQLLKFKYQSFITIFIIKEFISIVHQNVYETIIFVTFDKIMSQQECLQAWMKTK